MSPVISGSSGGAVSSVFTRTGAVVAAAGDYEGVVAAALTGATAATRYVGGTASGAPASGTFAVGDFVIDQTGKVQICTVAGTPGTWVAAGGTTATRYQQALTARGFDAENFPAALCTDSSSITSQLASFYGNLAILNGDTITGLVLNIATAAAGTNPTGAFVGLYTTAGVQLAVSNNLNASASFTTVGMQSFPFSAAYTATATQGVYAALLVNGTWGTTQAAFNGRTNASDAHFLFPFGANQAAFGFQSGQTTLPAPATISTNPGANTHVFWCALYT